jgi:hypothetical protein
MSVFKEKSSVHQEILTLEGLSIWFEMETCLPETQGFGLAPTNS